MVAAGLYAGSAALTASGASAAACTIENTWSNPSNTCLIDEQKVLGEDYHPIQVNPDQMTIPGLDYVDPNSTTGQALFEAMMDEGTLPEPSVFIADFGAMDMVGDVITPLAIGLTIAGAAITYGIELNTQTFSQNGETEMEGCGYCTGFPVLQPQPTWIHLDNICPDDPANYPYGDGSGWVLEWAGADSEWNAKYGTNQYADHGNGCGIPYYQDGDPSITGTQIGSDLAALQYIFLNDVVAWENNCFDGDTSAIQQSWNGVNSSGSGDLSGWYLTDTQMRQLVACQIEQLKPAPVEGAQLIEQTAPDPTAFPNTADFAEATGALQNDPASDGTVNKALTGTDDPNTNEDGTTGSAPGCDTSSVPPVDWTPLEEVNGFDNVFPFAVFHWLASGIAGWEGDGRAPSFSIPLLGIGHGQDVTVDMSFMDSEMPTIRGVFLIAFTLLAFYAIASGLIGAGGSSSE